MRCFLVLLCVTLASTGPDTPQAGFWTWIPALTHLQGALQTWIPVLWTWTPALPSTRIQTLERTFWKLKSQQVCSARCLGPAKALASRIWTSATPKTSSQKVANWTGSAKASQGRSRNGWQRKRQNSRSMGMCLAFFGNNVWPSGYRVWPAHWPWPGAISLCTRSLFSELWFSLEAEIPFPRSSCWSYGVSYLKHLEGHAFTKFPDIHWSPRLDIDGLRRDILTSWVRMLAATNAAAKEIRQFRRNPQNALRFG